MWYSATRVGILEIDMDHGNIDTMLQLYFAGKVPEAFLENIFTGLVRHFEHEERIIAELGRTFPADHSAEHKRLQALLAVLLDDWRAAKLTGKELAERLRAMLLFHVTEFDVKLRPDSE